MPCPSHHVNGLCSVGHVSEAVFREVETWKKFSGVPRFRLPSRKRDMHISACPVTRFALCSFIILLPSFAPPSSSPQLGALSEEPMSRSRSPRNQEPLNIALSIPQLILTSTLVARFHVATCFTSITIHTHTQRHYCYCCEIEQPVRALPPPLPLFRSRSTFSRIVGKGDRERAAVLISLSDGILFKRKFFIYIEHVKNGSVPC